jgi:glycosyltransferase involved in cell wall biosynthesis
MKSLTRTKADKTIVFSGDYFSFDMGYAENTLPWEFASRGYRVFLVVSQMQFYGDDPFYEEVYSAHLGSSRVVPGIANVAGVTVIRLPILFWWKRFKVAKSRLQTVARINPDYVYSWDPRSSQSLELAILSICKSFKFFVANHTVASVYPAYYDYPSWSFSKKLYLLLSDSLFGFLVGLRAAVCFNATPDADEISTKYMCIPKSKSAILPLAIDTQHFKPLDSISRSGKRRDLCEKYSININSIICLYTGRFTLQKNPLCLAQAIDCLSSNGYEYVAFFVGSGAQSQEIAAFQSCFVMPFLSYKILPDMMSICDIGVWPHQESISMLEAASCGLPIIVSDQVKDKNRYEGNGLSYKTGDSFSLANSLLQLRSAEDRFQYGAAGRLKVEREFSLPLLVEKIEGYF